MQITTLRTEYLPAAAGLFVENLKHLRRHVPELPGRMEDPDQIIEKLNSLAERQSGLVALEDGRPIGYLGWFIVEDFRDTDRRAAYCPEWSHATISGGRRKIYPALYRAAAQEWAAQGCGMHAVTLLANEAETREAWFWCGFGLMVVDAVRAADPVGGPAPDGFRVRPATSKDGQSLNELDVEHSAHYAASPVFMHPRSAASAAEFEEFLNQPNNGVWLALEGEWPVGFIQFEAGSFGAAEVVRAPDTIAITGAYARPEYRGRRLAAAILDAALRNYASRGFVRCSVDFESSNPEAAYFWVKYFRPVCYSVARVPESTL